MADNVFESLINTVGTVTTGFVRDVGGAVSNKLARDIDPNYALPLQPPTVNAQTVIGGYMPLIIAGGVLLVLVFAMRK
jgi:hypothetical protein